MTKSVRRMDGTEIKLDIDGLGIVLYSPELVAHIHDGDDYLETSFTTDEQVVKHILDGSLVRFDTCSPGIYLLKFHDGYPTAQKAEQSEFTLRLGLTCRGGVVCFRDLYDLMDWTQQCPPGQTLELEDGFYHVTLCSNLPPSGVIGDNQIIHVYLQKLNRFPPLAHRGIPALCF